ncbi:MAG: DNA polymerase III subunit delta, partial [Thermodesulfobacteriota bacterium]
MNSQEFFREIQRGKLLPLYYFWGPEKWLVEDALKKIEEKALDPATREFNREVMDGEEEAAETIVASLQVFPIRSPSRMVIIRNADGIWKKTPSIFIDYFHNPNPQSCAVFIGEKTDQRTKFFQALEDKGAIVAFFPPYEKELHRWVRSRAEQLGHPISEEASTLLLERIGPSLQDIQTELQKIILGKEPGKEIEEEDVLTMTEDTRSENLFDLPRAVGHLDSRKSLRLLRKNLQQGEPEQIWTQYMTLAHIEAAFRHLKQELRLRPLFHQKEHRVEAHILLSYLAYVLLWVIEHTHRSHGGSLSGRRILEVLSGIELGTVTLRAADGRKLELQRLSTPRPEEAQVLASLGVALPRAGGG